MSRNTGPDAATVILVQGRDNGWCLRCRKVPGFHCHHRKPRGMGGTRDPQINAPQNLAWLCVTCHQHVESHRTDAYREGWIVARNANPAEQYLITTDRRMLMLTADGGMEQHQLPNDYEEVPF